MYLIEIYELSDTTVYLHIFVKQLFTLSLQGRINVDCAALLWNLEIKNNDNNNTSLLYRNKLITKL